ncbi:MAG: LysM peptidoglycan-binding domain-containing protein [Nitrospira sp. SB0672_bin_25]|nr:LysM peptidoglycan-binding domain-containing protein [Nitrospira sp. SB0678_bin_10]MYJ54358.1 LysM peptidoglycan-binding domain-containing protein [Nitrospira sp. SB0672_bin_25]
MIKINWLEGYRSFWNLPLVSTLCLSGFLFSAGDVRAAGMSHSPDAVVSSSLPLPANPRGLMYFPPDRRSATSVPLNSVPSTLRQAQGSGQVRAHQGSEDLGYEDIPVIVNPAVERNIHYFQNVIHDRFQEWLTRFYAYRPLVEEIFVEVGLPKELIYLSLVESGFNPRAYSRARASGPWQFIKSTGRLYGLSVNWYVDERRDPIKSTVAAAVHLRDLYDTFGSWPLALAAYNAGAGKISRAIQKTGTRDFWRIARTRYIRRETRQYVPRFMAAMIIATRPSLFGFHAHSQTVHQYDEIRMDESIHLRSVAKETGISFDELRRLNPELRRSVTPPGREGYYLKVPVGTSESVEQAKSRMKTWTQPAPPARTWYRVRRGDSLSVIAHRFGTSVRQLRNLNDLSGSLIRVGQRLRVARGGKDVTDSGDVKWYRVRRGDSLWSIAKRFRVSVQDLKILNNLRSSLIRAGRMLMITS